MNMLQKEVQRIKLNDLCHVVTKGTTPTSVGLAFSDCGIPFLRIQNLSNKTISLKNVLFIDEKTHNTLKRSVIKPRDFLITIAGTIGKVAIVPDEFPESNCNQAIAILRCDNAKLHPEYLFHWLHTQDALQQITGKKVTATISNLSLGQIKNLEIPLPPLTQQKQIAAILDAADSLRHKDQQLVEHYTALSQSLFLEMFGDPTSNPMGWVISSLKSLTTKIGSGATPRGGKNAYRNDGVSLIRSLNIHDNKFLMKDLAHINDEQSSDLSNVIVEKQDVLLNITGASVCRCAIVPFDVLPARVNQHVCIIRTDKSKLNPLYLLHLITSARFKQKILAVAGAGGATREALTKKDVEDLNILVPPIELQNQFAERIVIIEQQKQQAQANLQKSEALFNSLLQRAFTGELTADKAA